MMDLFLLIAAKSLLVAGAVLLLLKFAHRRSAADRSWIAHLGLAAVLLLPVAAVALPALEVAGPAFLAQAPVESGATTAAPAASATTTEAATTAGNFPAATAPVEPAPVDWAFWAYAGPAALLLLLTLIALARLVALKARATVLVEPHWLTALAHAQRRMGFKHGTALLTSDDLPSPISWGLMRPVILLNSAAANSHKEAEAIIAHELAHVASLDWLKLLLARVTTAVFWFNPLVWVLAREAHQLREEAADDAVLGADIEDTEYAKLLVGVARHECRGLLIGAHGVAPAKNSLSRRVRRVLDSALARAPGGWRWSAAAGFFAAGMAVPLAALNFVPPTPASAAAGQGTLAAKTHSPVADRSYYVGSPGAGAAEAAVAGSAVAGAVAASVAASAHPHPASNDEDRDFDFDFDFDPDVDVNEPDIDVDVDVRPVKVKVKPPRPLNLNPGRSGRTRNPVDAAVAAKIHGVTPEYIAAIRAASPQLASADMDDLVAFKIHGVTPAFLRALEGAGFRNLTANQVTSAAVHRMSPEFLRGIAAAGYRPSFKQALEMRIFGVTPEYIAELRRAGFAQLSAGEIIKMRIHGIDANDLRSAKSDP